MNRLICLIISTLLLIGCGEGGREKNFSVEGLDTLYIPKFAEGFSLYSYGNSSVLVVKKAWQESGENELYYFLSRDGETPPEGFQGGVLNLPLSSMVCMSSSYIAFYEMLGADSLIKGISGGGFITSPTMRKRLEAGEVKDVGFDSGINKELLLDINPDIILLYGISGENTIVTDKLRELGLKTLYVGDYLENSPRGRAEWIVALGEIADKRDRAEMLFNSISAKYEEALALLPDTIHRPKVMLNAPWKDTWFVPGDRNYIVQLINDAGGEYICAGEDTDASKPISLEAAYGYAVKADLWLNPGDVVDLAGLKAANPRFINIPSVISGEVYNNNARRNERGGSDFWESGAVMPYIVLKDMIKIIHPEIIPSHNLYYFHKLQ